MTSRRPHRPAKHAAAGDTAEAGPDDGRANVVDSSAWLEYFGDGPNAGFFAPSIERTARLVVPTIVLSEVYRRITVQRSEREALDIVAQMQLGRMIDLSSTLAMRAASLGVQHRLPLADSIVYATAAECDGVVWTQDADFERLPGVRYREHAKRGA